MRIKNFWNLSLQFILIGHKEHIGIPWLLKVFLPQLALFGAQSFYYQPICALLALDFTEHITVFNFKVLDCFIARTLHILL